MYTIREARWIAPKVRVIVIEAPLIAKHHKAGHFIILRVRDEGERIPLTIADSDPEAGTITIVVQAVGLTTEQLCAHETGDAVLDVAGPMGKATDIEKFGHVVLVGGGVGTAVIFPMSKTLKAAGNKVSAIMGGRSKQYVIMEDELANVCDNVYPCTDDGSYGYHGFVTNKLQELIDDKTNPINTVLCAGPVPMMQALAEVTRPSGIQTIASLNPIMMDGTGMCGGCRVSVGGKQLFACVDGPEFDAHEVDFKELADRNTAFREQELAAQERHKQGKGNGVEPHECRLEGMAEDSDGTDDDIGERRTEKLKASARLKISRQSMPEQDAEERARNFLEVNLGLATAVARKEADRCLLCKKPQCVGGCPVGVDIPGFVDALSEGDLPKAADILFDTNVLPAITGRVCPQETQCEAYCTLGVKGDSLAVGYLERFVADWAKDNRPVDRNIPESSGKKIAIVGGGPAGLTCAGELIRLGHEVTIYEALHKAGGVLVYGIPEFRLPNEIVEQEVQKLKDLGVKIECNVIIGQTYTIEELISDEGFDSIFIANGAGLPVFLGIPGENLKGVFSANEFLTRINLMEAYRGDEADTPMPRSSSVVVVGGGNTAMDAVRVATRMGKTPGTLVYRRSREEMPARAEEVHHAEQEGIVFEMLVNPTEIVGDDKGWVKGVKCERMELGEPDDSGRRRPIPVKGSEFEIPCDMFIQAVGTRANPLLTQTTPALKVNKWGYIEIDDNGMTSIPGVFAGGDIVRGAATVILAMGDGKRAAAAINDFLTGASPVKTLESASASL